MVPETELRLRAGNGIECSRRRFSSHMASGQERFLDQVRAWLGPVSRVETAEFEITAIEEISRTPLAVGLDIRYGFVLQRDQQQREERVGSWRTEWSLDQSAAWKVRKNRRLAKKP